ncbi:hypothetical protein N7539_002830 [Penicillium diatomitis]|uniref:DNA repair protein Dds20/Sfr1 n=1 Tax=Penicillium diatomitis TaxID=2819901 RepID=A0A9X0BZG4_9EURO|nr:uncharacterized protein N7539_002830 [Penicillium diatomitis]KAJ5491263.1 hypothetical protein N7539_002830 [Penicillium diatomitis]
MANHHTPSKHRRLNAAAALSKPFKSPLRRLDPPTDASGPSHKVTEAAHTSPETNLRSEESAPVPDLQSRKRSPEIAARPMRVAKRSAFASPLQSPCADPELLRLQKEERTMLARVAALKEELNLVKEAIRIESSNRDHELEALILKWRNASQEAANEVFEHAQERIARMGGLQAWRERSQQDAVRWNNDIDETQAHGNDDDNQTYDLEEGLVHGKDSPQNTSQDLSSEVILYPNSFRSKIELDLIPQSQDFTMGFMLRTMKIDERLIGFDSVSDKWSQPSDETGSNR